MKSSFFFLKYKKILAPFEILKKSTDIGWKCRKYVKWGEVHCSSASKEILKKSGDELIEESSLNFKSYEELSGIFTRVQSWARNKDNPEYDLLPEVLPEYEKLQRAIVAGSKRPGLVDQIIINNKFLIDDVPVKKRWNLFCALEIQSYFRSNRRFTELLSGILGNDDSSHDGDVSRSISLSSVLIREALGLYCLSESEIKKTDIRLIEFFLECIDLPSHPENENRSNIEFIAKKTNVLIEQAELDRSIFVGFDYVEGQLIIKQNILHRAFYEDSAELSIYKNESFWLMTGEALLSHLGKIEIIQAFFTSLGLKLSDRT
jgi:hypothetical protein